MNDQLQQKVAEYLTQAEAVVPTAVADYLWWERFVMVGLLLVLAAAVLVCVTVIIVAWKNWDERDQGPAFYICGMLAGLFSIMFVLVLVDLLYLTSSPEAYLLRKLLE